MRADQLEQRTVSDPHHKDTLAAVQSHCAYTSTHNRARWLARVDTGAEPAMPAIIVNTVTIPSGAGHGVKEVADVNVVETRSQTIDVCEGGSKLLSDLNGCTINVHCKLHQLRLTRVVDTTVHLEHGVMVALEGCSGVRFVVGGGDGEVKVRDFTPNRLVPNYTIRPCVG